MTMAITFAHQLQKQMKRDKKNKTKHHVIMCLLRKIVPFCKYLNIYSSCSFDFTADVSTHVQKELLVLVQPASQLLQNGYKKK